MTSDNDTVTVSRGMLRRWAETLEHGAMSEGYAMEACSVVAEAARAVLAPGSDTAGEETT